MKKMFCMILIGIYTLVLAACSVNDEESTNRELDFRSILDIETNVILSLGDNQSVFDNALGEGDYHDGVLMREDLSSYGYADNLLNVVFYQGKAVRISVFNEDGGHGHDRFEFYQMSFDMADEELDNYFSEGPWHHRYYDENGQNIPATDDFEYLASVIMGIEGITNLTIARRIEVESDE